MLSLKEKFVADASLLRYPANIRTHLSEEASFNCVIQSLVPRIVNSWVKHEIGKNRAVQGNSIIFFRIKTAQPWRSRQSLGVMSQVV